MSNRTRKLGKREPYQHVYCTWLPRVLVACRLARNVTVAKELVVTGQVFDRPHEVDPIMDLSYNLPYGHHFLRVGAGDKCRTRAHICVTSKPKEDK